MPEIIGAPRLFRAPGRVNLIGEHTDYNDGFVMPVAIDFFTQIILFPLDTRALEFYSDHFKEKVVLDFDNLPKSRSRHWSDYVVGVALMLIGEGHELRGARLMISSNVPIGSGLSSSAALEVATAYALATTSDLKIERVELAKLCRRAENEFVGARVGIMDQFVSFFGESDKALLLDCRSLEFEHLPVPPSAQLVICNTMVKHDLASGAYNERRQQCEEGVKLLRTVLPNVTALRDVTSQQLEEHRKELPEVIYRRCRHVVTENERVLDAASALKQGDVAKFGQLMNQSHQSLRDDYEVSCAELDLMVGLARKVEGVFGARMTGGGFGGCTVNLVRRDKIDEFQNTVAAGYQEATGLTPEVYVCKAVKGAEELPMSDML
ncbi:MAG TPA: galactokinase [Pyrinomonadaceae bacterium]|nr:galactokinase [Pyrinomonadaceae bacterium]